MTAYCVASLVESIKVIITNETTNELRVFSCCTKLTQIYIDDLNIFMVHDTNHFRD